MSVDIWGMQESGGKINLLLQRRRHTRSCGCKHGGVFLFGDGNKCLQDVGIKLGSTAATQARNRFRVWKALPVAAIRDHRIESVDDGNDSRNHGNVVPLQSSRIASPIHVFVMVQSVETRLFETREQAQN